MLTGTSLAAVTERQVRIAVAPLASVTELMCEAVDGTFGSSPALLAAVRGALEPCDVALLAPLFRRNVQLFLPDCLTPTPHVHAPTFEAELERLVAISTEELEQEIVTYGQARTGWIEAARSPRRWLDAYVAALRRAWSGVKPLWLQAVPLIEREVERVGVGLARGALAEIIADVSPRSRVEDDRWYLACHDAALAIAPGLVLQPMVVGPQAGLAAMSGGEVSYFAYSLPRAHWQLGSTNGRARRTGLEALVGEPRAEILRRLDRPLSAGQLANDLLFAPSAITHHLVALERAGLAHREREGRHVMVSRTARGTSLLHLYER